MPVQKKSVTTAVIVTLATMLVIFASLFALGWHVRPHETMNAPSRTSDDDPWRRHEQVQACQARIHAGQPLDEDCRELFAR